MERKKLMRIIVKSLKGNGAKRISIFGSYARHDDVQGSDVDVLVEFSGRKSLLDIVRIERELSEKSGLRVDLVTRKSMSPLIMEKIKNDLEVIYQ